MEQPLFVDLDGTLLRTDMLFEGIMYIARHNPLLLFLLPAWLLKGKASLKHNIAKHSKVTPSHLPYNENFLAYLIEQKKIGRKLILSTASHINIATPIADHLGIFDGVIASNNKDNMTGKRKLEAMVAMNGSYNFVYAGNAKADLIIWQHCVGAILVNCSKRTTKKTYALNNVIKDLSSDKKSIKEFFNGLRVHQWTKNLLIYISLLMSHNFTDSNLLLYTSLGFLSFSLCASAAYILNDLLDLEADRRHSTKKHRPFATGNISILSGLIMAPTLLLCAFIVGGLISKAFVVTLFIYFSTTLAYSMWLKKIAVIDCITLASLYTLRIIAGAIIMLTLPSFWLMAFSMFIFLSLAIAKRFSELKDVIDTGGGKLNRRGYYSDDIETLSSLGITSGFMAVLVLALYIDSDAISKLYSHPEFVWLLCPALMFWISRFWLITRRGELYQDPVVFAIKDKQSHIIAVFCLLVLWLATVQLPDLS